MSTLQQQPIQYNISPSLIGRLEYLIRYFNTQKRIMEDFTKCMSDRADLEIQYQKGLEKIAEQLQCLSENQNTEQNMGAMFMSLRSCILTHSEQSELMATNLKNDVQLKMFKIRQEQYDEVQKYTDEVKTIEYTLHRHIQNLEDVKKSYYSKFKELEEITVAVNAITNQSSPEQQIQQGGQQAALKNRQQLYTRKEKLEEQNQTLQEKVKSVTLEYNSFLDRYFDQIARITESNRIMEEERNEFLKDSIMKFLVFQISYIKHIEYDYGQISNKVEVYKRKFPIVQFKDQNTSQLLSKLNFEDFKQFIEKEYSNTKLDKKRSNKQNLVYISDIDMNKIQDQVNVKVNGAISKMKNLFNPKNLGGTTLINLVNQEDIEIYTVVPKVETYQDKMRPIERIIEHILSGKHLDFDQEQAFGEQILVPENHEIFVNKMHSLFKKQVDQKYKTIIVNNLVRLSQIALNATRDHELIIKLSYIIKQICFTLHFEDIFYNSYLFHDIFQQNKSQYWNNILLEIDFQISEKNNVEINSIKKDFIKLLLQPPVIQQEQQQQADQNHNNLSQVTRKKKPIFSELEKPAIHNQEVEPENEQQENKEGYLEENKQKGEELSKQQQQSQQSSQENQNTTNQVFFTQQPDQLQQPIHNQIQQQQELAYQQQQQEIVRQQQQLQQQQQQQSSQKKKNIVSFD